MRRRGEEIREDLAERNHREDDRTEEHREHPRSEQRPKPVAIHDLPHVEIAEIQELGDPRHPRGGVRRDGEGRHGRERDER